MKLFSFLGLVSMTLGALTSKLMGFDSPESAKGADLSEKEWQGKFDAAESTLSELEASLTAISSERDTLAASVSTLTSDLEAKTTALADSTKNAESLQEKVNELTATNKALEAKLDKAPEMVVPGSTAGADPVGGDEKEKAELQAKIDDMPHNKKADQIGAVFGKKEPKE